MVVMMRERMCREIFEEGQGCEALLGGMVLILSAGADQGDGIEFLGVPHVELCSRGRLV